MEAVAGTTVVTVLTPAKVYHVPFTVPTAWQVHSLLKSPLEVGNFILTEL